MFFKIFKHRSWAFIGFLVVSSFVLTFLVNNHFSGSEASKPEYPKQIVIGFSNHPSWWPWMVAEEEKLFEANKLNAKLNWYDNYSDSVRDFQLGLLDANSELVIGKKEIQNFAESSKRKVLLNTYSNGDDQLIVKPGINSLEDLERKTIIAESNEILNLFLKNNRLLKQRINIQFLETGLASSAFVTDKNIDGVLSYPPYSDIALRIEGAKAIATSADFPQEIARMLVLQNNLANQSPEIVEKLKATWFDGLAFIYENPIKAKTIIAQKLNLDTAQIAQAQNSTKLIGKNENSRRLAKQN